MNREELRRRSRWVMRAMEWDDARAKYPNIWHEGMPRNVLVASRVGSRLRLGDLIAVYYPTSKRHAARSQRFLGISRIAGLRHADHPDHDWVDLETAHRFDPPQELGEPGRVFLCCDPGWPGPEVELFRKVFAAAEAAGWKPSEFEREATSRVVAPAVHAAEPTPAPAGEADQPVAEDSSPQPGARVEPVDVGESSTEARAEPSPVSMPLPTPDESSRKFAGVDYSGDMRDPRYSTWLAALELCDDRLRVIRLEATGRSGLQAYLRDPDRGLMNVEAIGMDFPFGLPVPFAEKLLGGPFPDEGWWALVRRIERLARPTYLTSVQEFRDEHGEVRRLADEQADSPSPLRRSDPDLGSRAFHGIRMIAEDRSRYAVRPFETAQGRLLLEVNPAPVISRLANDGRPRLADIVSGLSAASFLPIEMHESYERTCLGRRDALNAVVAARCAAVAVVTGEADRSPEDLAPGAGDRVRREGWIYGLKEPA